MILDNYEIVNELDKYDDITIYESEIENEKNKESTSDNSSSYTDEEHIYSGKNLILLKKGSKNEVIEEESETNSEEPAKLNSKKNNHMENTELNEGI